MKKILLGFILVFGAIFVSWAYYNPNLVRRDLKVGTHIFFDTPEMSKTYEASICQGWISTYYGFGLYKIKHSFCNDMKGPNGSPRRTVIDETSFRFRKDLVLAEPWEMLDVECKAAVIKGDEVYMAACNSNEHMMEGNY